VEVQKGGNCLHRKLKSCFILHITKKLQIRIFFQSFIDTLVSLLSFVNFPRTKNSYYRGFGSSSLDILFYRNIFREVVLSKNNAYITKIRNFSIFLIAEMMFEKKNYDSSVM
jgi:hypothetical protein